MRRERLTGLLFAALGGGAAAPPPFAGADAGPGDAGLADVEKPSIADAAPDSCPRVEGSDAGCQAATVAGAWTAMAEEGAPSPRIEHAAIWTGSEMIIWGGYNVN